MMGRGDDRQSTNDEAGTRKQAGMRKQESEGRLTCLRMRHDDAACRQRSHPYLPFNHRMYCDDCTNQALTALLYKYVLQPPAFGIDAPATR